MVCFYKGQIPPNATGGGLTTFDRLLSPNQGRFALIKVKSPTSPQGGGVSRNNDRRITNPFLSLMMYRNDPEIESMAKLMTHACYSIYVRIICTHTYRIHRAVLEATQDNSRDISLFAACSSCSCEVSVKGHLATALYMCVCVCVCVCNVCMYVCMCVCVCVCVYACMHACMYVCM